MSSRTNARQATVTDVPAARPTSRRSWFVPVVLVASALALVNGVVRLGSFSIARDEGFSTSTSLRSWSALVKLSVHTETNAWLYALVLKAWSALGTSLFTLRLLSVLAFVATVPLVAVLARRLFGDRVAVVAAVLTALNGSLLMQGQLIRGYPFAVACAVAATIAFVAEVRSPNRSALVWWVVLGVAGAQFHIYTFLVCAGHVASLLFVPVGERRLVRRLGALGIGVLAMSPVAYAISTHDEGQGLYKLDREAVFNVLNVFAGRAGMVGLAGFAAGGLYLLVMAVRPRRAEITRALDLPTVDRWPYALVAALVAVPALLLLAASLVSYPTFVGRYLLFSVPALIIGVAALIDRLLAVGGARRSLAIVGVAALTVTAVAGTVTWRTAKTENWTGAATYVFAQAQPTDKIIVANDVVRLFFEYTRSQVPHNGGPQWAWPTPAWGGYGTGDHLYDSPTAPEMSAAATGATDRLWVVVAREQPNTDVMPERLASLSPTFQLLDKRSYEGPIDVYLYQRVSS